MSKVINMLTELVKYLINNFRKLGVEKIFRSKYIETTITVIVDETVSVEEAVKACNLAWSDEYITSKNFPQTANEQKLAKEVALFFFNREMSSEEVIAKMDRAGYKPATIWDLLGLAIKQPNLQRKFPILALGSRLELDGDIRVFHLSGALSSVRGLAMTYFDFVWSEKSRFAGVRKTPQTPAPQVF